jgi:hypothetical protein
MLRSTHILYALTALGTALSAVNGLSLSRSFLTSTGGRHRVFDDGPLAVDLGYSVYRGVKDSSKGINSWLGYKFALDL